MTDSDAYFERTVESLLPEVVGAILENEDALKTIVRKFGAVSVAYAGHGQPVRLSHRQRILENFRNSLLVRRRLAEGVPMWRLFGSCLRHYEFRVCREAPADFVPCHPGTHFEVPVEVRGVGTGEEVEIGFVLRGILKWNSLESGWSVERPTADQVTVSC